MIHKAETDTEAPAPAPAQHSKSVMGYYVTS